MKETQHRLRCVASFVMFVSGAEEQRGSESEYCVARNAGSQLDRQLWCGNKWSNRRSTCNADRLKAHHCIMYVPSAPYVYRFQAKTGSRQKGTVDRAEEDTQA